MNTSPNPRDLDGLLRGYFQAQLPRTWPEAPLVVEIARQRSPVASRGRLTLAASVAALLGFGAVLSYSPQTGNSTSDPSLLKDATANGKKLDQYIFPEHQPKLPGTEP